ncbi:hypothetical protein OAP63_05590 [Vibrio sp.]|nr:hypothetical protein [Vibrio sp.]
MTSIFDRLIQKKNKYLCSKQLDKIYSTPPIKYQPSEDVIVFSMIGKQHIAPYLVAIKSFLTWFNHISVHLLNDGSLDKDDISLITSHVPGIHISHISDIDTGKMPKGGCWERLIKLVSLLEHNYVVQLDSDIVVGGPLVEVYEHIQNQHSFTIGNPRWPQPAPVEYIADVAKKWDSNHVQTLAEIAMPSIPMLQNEKFCITRGCAGFCGLPKGSISIEFLETFSLQMEDAIGNDKWHEWGSEQVASNFLVSKSNGAHILSWPKYQNYSHPQSNEPVNSACVVHFMGTNRYDQGAYKQMAEKTISALINS